MKISRYAVIFILVASSLPGASGLSPIPDYNFDKNFNDLASSNLTLGNITRLGALPYEDIMGTIFWGILFVLIFGVMWISMEDITIPTLLGMIIGGSIWTLMPPEWVSMGMSLTVISFAGIVYSYLKKG